MDDEQLSWWERNLDSQAVADKSTCLPELTPTHTKLKNSAIFTASRTPFEIKYNHSLKDTTARTPYSRGTLVGVKDARASL